jgi:hypothetical protein
MAKKAKKRTKPEAPGSAAKKHGAPSVNVLYVVLHGLVCLVDAGAEGFIAYLPEVGNVHRYMCGHFLGEFDIHPAAAPARFRLSDGVAKGSAKLDSTKNAIVKLAGLPSDTTGVRAVIKLGRPNAIDHRLLGDVDPSTLIDNGGDLVAKPAQISAIRIFEYSFKDFKKVSLIDEGTGKAFWECPQPMPVTHNKNASALHIYNEPPQVLDDPNGHNVEEFRASLRLLGSSVDLTRAAVVNPGNQPSPATKPDGILGWEIAALDIRNKRGAVTHVQGLRSGGSAGDPLGGGDGSQVCGGANGLVVR